MSANTASFPAIETRSATTSTSTLRKLLNLLPGIALLFIVGYAGKFI